MLELFFNDINSFKFYFFIFSSFILFFLYLNYGLKTFTKNTLILFLVFLLILIHSLIFSYNSDFSTRQSLYSLSILFTFYFIIKLVGSNFIFKYYIKIILFFTAIFLISSDLILLVFNSSIFYVDSNFRGILQNSNTLALYLSVFIAPVIFHLYFLSFQLKKSFFIFIILSNIFYILLLTKSRTGIVIFIIIGIYFYLFNNPKLKSKLKGIIYVLFFIILSLIIFNNKIADIIYKNNKESITSTRNILWIARITAIKEKPFFGWGYQINEYSYIDKYHEFNKLEKGNTILALIEEFGFIFGSIIIFMLIYIFYKILKIINTMKNYYFINITIIATLLHSLLETWLFNFNGLLTMFFWLIILSTLELKKDINE